MPAPVPPDPDAVAFAAERRKAGLSLPAIAEEMKAIGHPVTAMTISRWLADPSAPKEPRGPRRKAAAQRPRQALSDRKPPSSPPGAPDTAPDDALGSTLDTLRRMLASTLKEAESARVLNPKLSQQLGRDAANMANTIARLEKGAEDDSDVLRVTRKEIDEAAAGLLERIQAMCSRGPLRCAECNRALSVDLGTGGKGGSEPGRAAPAVAP